MGTENTFWQIIQCLKHMSILNQKQIKMQVHIEDGGEKHFQFAEI